ncbi:MAG: hypothetical protein FJW35_18800 [Acidobacteria bacterium]|nr:hypothetical protein [Acidobacteriota bacterium]
MQMKAPDEQRRMAWVLIATLIGVLERESPDLVRRLRRNWVPPATFTRTLGDGTLSTRPGPGCTIPDSRGDAADLRAEP